MNYVTLSLIGVLFGTPDVRTDLVETTVNIAAAISGQEDVSGQTVTYGLGALEEESDSRDVSVQFVSWREIGEQCGRFSGGPSCYDDGLIYVYEYGMNSYTNLGYLGAALVEALGVPKGGLGPEQELGRKFLRHVRKPEAPTFVWQGQVNGQ